MNKIVEVKGIKTEVFNIPVVEIGIAVGGAVLTDYLLTKLPQILPYQDILSRIAVAGLAFWKLGTIGKFLGTIIFANTVRPIVQAIMGGFPASEAETEIVL